MQIEFPEVRGYATRERAIRRGQEAEAIISKLMVGKLPPRWLVVQVKDGRWAPAFYCGDVQGGPGPFIGMINVCCFN